MMEYWGDFKVIAEWNSFVLQYILVKHISNRGKKNPSVNLNTTKPEEMAKESRKGYRFKLPSPHILGVSCSPQSTQNSLK